MLKNLVIKNFRCFTSILLNPLARVNVITGRNNTGKTALLEALQIHSYPQECGLPFSIHGLRGFMDVATFSEEVGRWLFWNAHTSQGFEISSQDDSGVSRTLQVRLVDAATARAQFPEAEQLLASEVFTMTGQGAGPRLIFRSESQGKVKWAIGELTGHMLRSAGIDTAWFGPSVYLSSGTRSLVKDAQTFSKLEITKRQDEFLPSLQLLEPRLRKLSLLLFAGTPLIPGTPLIHGDIGLSQLVPVTLMGEGIRRLLSLVMAIATASGGRVLIDEIENGLHYSVLVQVWRAIAEAARRSDVQVFATTHSWECIRAAHEAFSAMEPYDFRLHRLDRTDGSISAVTYDREMLEAALVTGLEVR